MSNSGAILKIKSRVWKKDNVELIDYLNHDTLINYISVTSSGVLRKSSDKKVTFLQGDNFAKTEMDLVKIHKNNNSGRYLINCGTWPKELSKLVDQQGIFLVYRGLTLKDLNRVKTYRYYKLSQGDIIKLGRIYFKVLEINLKKNNINSKKTNPKINGNTILHSSNSSSFIINQQQIIQGIYSPKWNNKKHSQIMFNINNSLITARNNKLQNNNDSIDLFTKRKVMPLLPRINSSNDLFVLKKISKSKKLKSSQDLDNIILKPTNPITKNKNKPSCRICYGEDTNEENPLICPCICKGSMKYIHYQCLRNWLNSKIEEEFSEETIENNQDCISYNRKEIACELCKEKFPDYIIHNNIYYNILFYKPKFEEFIILESMKSSIVKNKYYHVISFDNKEFINIGRATECELSLPELSVSRNHCLIHKEKGKLYLEDNTSKFGTLVLIQNKNMIVNDFMTLKIQVKKTFLKFKLDIPFSFSWGCCGRSDTIERMDYQAQNKKGFDVMSCFIIKEDNNNNLISDDIDEEKKKTIAVEDNKKNNDKVSGDENESNKNNDENKEEIINELIDKESINEINNSINKNEKEQKKESLIDQSKLQDMNNKGDINNDINENNIDKKEEIKEEEKKIDNKNDIIDNILHNKKINENINNRNEINFKVNNLLINHIKKISIKKGKNDKLELPKLEHINIDNIKENFPISFLSDSNHNKLYETKTNKDKKDIILNERNNSPLNQIDTFSNNKIANNKNSFSLIEAVEHDVENINNNSNKNK